MNPTRTHASRRTALRYLSAVPVALGTSLAWAQAGYPSRPIRLVVTLPAGTSADVMARFIGERISRELAQPVIVDNRPGASSIIGAQAVAAAPADGYTLLYGLAPSISLNPHLYKKLPYKAADFVPIIHLLDVPFVLVVRADSPYRTAQDLFNAAKAQPDKLSYPSYGEGSPNHVAVLQMLQAAGGSMTHVPYKDGGLNDLLGGLVDCSLEVTAMAMQHIASGRLRPLAVSARSRLDKLPDVRTLQELNLGAPLYSWNGVFAPAGTPPEVVSRLAAVLQDITARADFRQKVQDFTQVPRGGTPAEFAAFLAKDSENWGRVV
ncbi:MAG TPA: tripartite tricarboxylate transporter substrate binding protein, partial [Burkholderiaceae bacterium]|nr:tripartite tricarboxylate transporter substrate binding protein [Burkholderiaceae bacterium]